MRDPDNDIAAAMLGDLFATAYQLGYAEDSALERAEALALDPNSQPARFTMALIHFLRGQRRLFLEEVERGLELNPNHALHAAASSVHLGMVGEWEKALKLMDKAMRLNPHHPGWYHLVPFMNHYRQGDRYSFTLRR
jgi:adenylate cyclase